MKRIPERTTQYYRLYILGHIDSIQIISGMNKVICLLILIIINLNLMHFIINLQYFIMFLILESSLHFDAGSLMKSLLIQPHSENKYSWLSGLIRILLLFIQILLCCFLIYSYMKLLPTVRALRY